MDITIVFVLVIGFVSSLIGSAAGGGGALISIPGLILLGLPPHIAVGTNKLGNIGTALSTIYTFEKAHLVNHKLVIPLAAIATVASFLGARFVVGLNEEILLNVIGVLILVALPFLLLSKNFGMFHKTTSKKRHEVGYVLFFLVAMYIGFLGAGGGFLVVMVLVSFFGLTFLEANGTFRIPWLCIVLASLVVFAYHGLVHYTYGIALLVSRLFGAFVGSRIAIHEGNAFVKGAIVVVVLACSVKMLFF